MAAVIGFAVPLLAGAATFQAVPTTAVAQTFIEGSEDVPLAPSLTTVAGTGMVFDSPTGRIVEAFATGRVDKTDILGFYGETLPALGWEAVSSDTFHREGERLTIDFFGVDGDLSVRFTLAPQ
jgi:hypothetical protein